MQKVDKSILVWNLETSTKLSRRNEQNQEKKVNSFFLLFFTEDYFPHFECKQSDFEYFY